MLFAVFRNFMILMALAFFAYHLDTFAQLKPKPQSESINSLLFLTENEKLGANLNYIDSGRSLLYSKELSIAPIVPATIHWTALAQSNILTYANKLDDGTLDLKVSVITLNPIFSIKTQSLPEILKTEFAFRQWVAKAPDKFFATTGNSLYFVTIGTRSQTKATLVHNSTGTSKINDTDIIDFDSAGKNVIFSYNVNSASTKTYYALNLATQKIATLKSSTACKGKVIHLNNRLVPMGENQFLAYCQATATTRAAFLFFDFTKLDITRYETREELTEETNFTVDSFGYFILLETINDRIVYCSGNIKQMQSTRCLNTASMSNGYIFSTGNPAQFYMIAVKNIFSIIFSNGISRRTSILFDAPLSGKVLPPVSL